LPSFIAGGVSEVQGLETEKELESIKESIKATIDLKCDKIKYLKEPKEEQGVIAIFHELIGAGILTGYKTLRSSAIEPYDAVIRYGVDKSNLDGRARDKVVKNSDYDIFVEFKKVGSDLLPDLENRKRARDVRLLVCWELGESKFSKENVEVDECDDSVFSGVTHTLTFAQRYQFGNENQKPVICLRTLIQRIRDGRG